MIISTRCGDIEGLFENGQYIFKGIPYAESPTGSLRFKRTQPKKSWNGILKCTEFSTMCIQNVGDNMKDKISEDSLTLNIWTKSVKEPKKAVVLWVHGGAFKMGSANPYNGANFADDDFFKLQNWSIWLLRFRKRFRERVQKLWK